MVGRSTAQGWLLLVVAIMLLFSPAAGLHFKLADERHDSQGTEYTVRYPIPLKRTNVRIDKLETVHLDFPDDLVQESSIRVVERVNDTFYEIPYQVVKLGDASTLSKYDSGFVRAVDLKFFLTNTPDNGTSYFVLVSPERTRRTDYSGGHGDMIQGVAPYIIVKNDHLEGTFTENGLMLRDADGTMLSDGDKFQERRTALSLKDLPSPNIVLKPRLSVEPTELGVRVYGTMVMLGFQHSVEYTFYDTAPVFERQETFSIPVVSANLCYVIFKSLDVLKHKWDITLYPENKTFHLDGDSNDPRFLTEHIPIQRGQAIVASSDDVSLVTIIIDVPEFELNMGYLEGSAKMSIPGLGIKDLGSIHFPNTMYHGMYFTNIPPDYHITNQCGDIAGVSTYRHITFLMDGPVDRAMVDELRSLYLGTVLEPTAMLKAEYYWNGAWRREPRPCGSSCSYDGECGDRKCISGLCRQPTECVFDNRCFQSGTELESRMCLDGEWLQTQTGCGSCVVTAQCQGGRQCIDSICRENSTVCGKQGRCFPSGSVYKDEYCEMGLFFRRAGGGAECDHDYECETGYACEDRHCIKRDGVTCTDDSECKSRHCSRGICCVQGRQCCRDDDQCKPPTRCNPRTFYCEVLCGNAVCDPDECSDCPSDCSLELCADDRYCSPEVGETCDTTTYCECTTVVRGLFDSSEDHRFGDTVFVDAEVQNIGDAPGTYDVAFTVNELNVLETRKGVRIGKNSLVVLPFNFTALAPFENVHATFTVFYGSGRKRPAHSETVTVTLRERRFYETTYFEYLFGFKEAFEIVVAIVTVFGLFMGYRSWVGRGQAAQPAVVYYYYPPPYESYYGQYGYSYPQDAYPAGYTEQGEGVSSDEMSQQVEAAPVEGSAPAEEMTAYVQEQPAYQEAVPAEPTTEEYPAESPPGNDGVPPSK